MGHRLNSLLDLGRPLVRTAKRVQYSEAGPTPPQSEAPAPTPIEGAHMTTDVKQATTSIKELIAQAKARASKLADGATAANANMTRVLDMGESMVDELTRDVAELQATLGLGSNFPPADEQI
jgi:hypothetical protein